MNRERLTILLDGVKQWQAQREAGVDGLPRFNMDTWYDYVPECLTACCVCGYGAKFIPELVAQGLNTDKYGFLHFEDNEGIEAAAAFFDLDRVEACWLFFSDSYGEPYDGTNERVALGDVIARIEETLA